jgi:hypothetical protein
LFAFVLRRGREWWVPGLAGELLVAGSWGCGSAVGHGLCSCIFEVAFLVAGTMFEVAWDLSAEDGDDDGEQTCHDEQGRVHGRVSASGPFFRCK